MYYNSRLLYTPQTHTYTCTYIYTHTQNCVLSVVLYGCKTSSVTPGEEQGLRELENKGLNRRFRPKKEEVTGSGKPA